jgi:hypothetical protein
MFRFPWTLTPTRQRDSAGRFQIALPATGAKVVARWYGYEQRSIDVAGRTDSGQVGVFALRPQRICDLRRGANGYPDVRVEVRDAITGSAPTATPTIEVTDGSFRDSAVIRPDSARRAVGVAALNREPDTSTGRRPAPPLHAMRSGGVSALRRKCTAHLVSASLVHRVVCAARG